jgi:tetratricopeptide (TPR) repeat protein
MLREYQGTLIRWLFGIGLLGLSFRCVTEGYERLDLLSMLLGFFFFILGICALWKTIFHLATRPFTLFIDSIFFPGGELSKPVLNLKLPAYYTNEGRYEEALVEYQRILRHYPDEIEAYEKAIWLYLEVFDQPFEAKKLLRRARRRRLPLDERIVLRAGEPLFGAHR